MPREVIGSSLYDTQVEVNWRRDGDAQIGILGNKPFVFLKPTDNCNCPCEPEKYVDGGGEIVDGHEENGLVRYLSLFADLRTRKDFNDLITILRRARDQVHGKDA
jgi:hypothetical protein